MSQQQGQPAEPPPPPLLPQELVDFATQRLWVTSALTALQAYKIYQFLETFVLDADATSPGWWLLVKWCLLDTFLVGWLIPQLRIPRLDFPMNSRIVLCLPLLALNYILFSSAFWAVLGGIPSLLGTAFLPDYKMAIAEHRVRPKAILDYHEHILGRHTVHILPHATAQINPSGQIFCLPVQGKSKSISIPLYFNNTVPHLLTYSVTSLETGEKSYFEATESQLKLQTALVQKAKHHKEEDYEDDWSQPFVVKSPIKRIENDTPKPPSHALHVEHIGIVKLEKILSPPPVSGEISFSRKDDVLITACPTFRLLPPSTNRLSTLEHKCLGDKQDIAIELSGVPPLSLEYLRTFTPSTRGKASVEPVKIGGVTGGAEKLTRGQSLKTTLPQQLSLTSPGTQSITLVSITDANGHAFTSEDKREQSVAVHPTPKVAFNHQQPIKLKSKTTGHVIMRVQPGEGSDNDGPWTVGMRLPGIDEVKEIEIGGGKNGTKQTMMSKYTVGKEGEYELLSLRGKYCAGEVLAPAAVSVIYQPEPSVDLNFLPITDECAGSIGLRAQVALTGEAPFRLHFKVTSKPGNGNKRNIKTTEQIRTINNAHDEIVFQPDQVGEFIWEATRLEDAVYTGNSAISLTKQKLRYTTEIHPLASARWLKEGPSEIRSCEGEGETIDAQVELKGTAPWTIEYETQSGTTRSKFVQKDVQTSPHSLKIAIPSKVNKNGGSFSVSITDIQDSRGCRRAIKTDDLVAHVHRTRPAARFSGTGPRGDRKVAIRDGQDTALPLRLNGEAPWSITYQLHPEAGKMPKKQTVKIASANGELLVNEEGTYELLEVKDRYCPGDIDAKESQFSVNFLPRPTLSVHPGDNRTKVSRWVPIGQHQHARRKPVCLNAMDSVDLTLEGSAPFRVSYTHIAPNERQAKSLFAVQPHANLALSTTQPGLHAYEIENVSDAVYEKGSDGRLLDETAARHVSRIRFEQEVLPLPSAVFRQDNKPPRYCVDDELGRSSTSTGLVLHLSGMAPFDLELEVKSVGSSNKPTRFPVHNIDTNDWSVVIPFAFKKAGKHEVTVWSVRDANGCETIVDKSAKTGASQWDEEQRQVVRVPAATVDVADVATIKALSPQTDHCVGDSLDFLLQGVAPWTITYLWQGQQSQVTTRKNTFSRLAEKQGVFAVTSISHQHDQCSSKVSDIAKVIHPLPRVKVREGKAYQEDIREGDTATIKFEFSGTPPFSFTYVRSSADWDQDILEEKTITDIYEHEYTLTTSEEGTWSTKFIADRYCSFPPRVAARHVTT